MLQLRLALTICFALLFLAPPAFARPELPPSEWQTNVNAARNLEELSRLLGALPNQCKPAGDGQETCLWRTSAVTYGHGRVAASVPVPGSKRVDLLCALPLDGSFRQSGDSCEQRPES